MANLIDGRRVTPKAVEAMTNCRLKQTGETLRRLLAMVEDEIDNRLGKGGGGLK